MEEQLIETVEDWNDLDMERKQTFAAQAEEDIQSNMEAETFPQPASVEIVIESGDMKAVIYVQKPENGGTDVQKEDITEELDRQGITYGINWAKIDEIVEEKMYCQLFVIAQGTPGLNGQNGKIKDFFPRKHELKFSSKSNGGIDFKSLNLIHNVTKGTVVCEITRPSEPVSGTNIYGNPVITKRGKMPEIPQGKNITYSEDRSKLIAACEGNLTFRSGRFHVENVYTISGNVDNAVGNIDFTGSVYIKGDVLEGYTVKAKGDITVMGMAEGAYLDSQGSIILHKGMRGMKKGILRAQGDITGKFLEDCTLHAQGNIQAEYIINSKVSCNKELILIGKRGALIGGTCAVCRRIRVNSLGCPSQTQTLITLGVTQELLEQVIRVSQELKDSIRQYEDALMNVEYLSKRRESGRITQAQEMRLNEFKIQIPVSNMKIQQLTKKKHELEQRSLQVGKSRLEAERVYPGTVITMGEDRLSVRRLESMCLYYYCDGQIQKGTY